ncbi:hypothetical protein [Halorubrum sp. HHNYT27]|uniref:hypothetical protein n=1 Tax=Halorubrum sp. HHNYT27 TaxID=3402275 RepID=UPI003EBE6345
MSSNPDPQNSTSGDSERTVSPRALRRAENLQIVVAIGILTVAGTLYVNDMIQFPLLESVASVSYVRQIFRYFIYVTIAFITIKVVTITIYPFSSNKYLYWFHDIVTPFLYTFSPLLLIFGTIIGATLGQVESDGIVTFAISLLSIVTAGYRTYKLVTEKKEAHDSIAIEFGITKIVSSLIEKEATRERPVKVSELSDRYSLNIEGDRRISVNLNEVLLHLEQDPDLPVEKQNNKIWLTDIDRAEEYVASHNNSPKINYWETLNWFRYKPD